MQNTIPQEHSFDLEANRQYQVPIRPTGTTLKGIDEVLSC